jgi:hypothetical protein
MDNGYIILMTMLAVYGISGAILYMRARGWDPVEVGGEG